MLQQEFSNFLIPTSVPVVGQFNNFQTVERSCSTERHIDLQSKRLAVINQSSDWNFTHHLTLETAFQVHNDPVQAQAL